MRQEEVALGRVSYAADADPDDARSGERAHGLHASAQALGAGGKGHAGSGVDPRAIRAEDLAYPSRQLHEHGRGQVADPGLGGLKQPAPVEAADGTSDRALADLGEIKALDPARPVVGAVLQPVHHAQERRELEDRLNEQQDRGGAGIKLAMAACGRSWCSRAATVERISPIRGRSRLMMDVTRDKLASNSPLTGFGWYLLHQGWGFLCLAIGVAARSHLPRPRPSGALPSTSQEQQRAAPMGGSTASQPAILCHPRIAHATRNAIA